MKSLISLALFLTVLAAGAAETTLGDLTGVWRGDQNGYSYELLIDGRNEVSPVMTVRMKLGQLLDDTTAGVPAVVGQKILLRHRSALTDATITEEYTITRFEGDDMTLTSALMQFGGVSFHRFACELPEKGQ